MLSYTATNRKLKLKDKYYLWNTELILFKYSHFQEADEKLNHLDYRKPKKLEALI